MRIGFYGADLPAGPGTDTEDQLGDGMRLASAAMVVRQLQQESMAHNIANVATPGYKASRVFAEVLSESGSGVDPARRAARNQKVYTDFSQGQVTKTERPLDLALEGEGFFVVSTPGGESYTRNGNFAVARNEMLVTHAGYPVLSDSGPILLQGSEIQVDEAGVITVDGLESGRLLIRNFASPDQLIRLEPGLFGMPADTEAIEVPPTARVMQGCLEESNVTALQEMVRMMSILQQFSTCQRVTQMMGSTLRRAGNDLILSQ